MSISRNEPCPCGSGKKYKKCCLKTDTIIQLDQVKEDRFLQQKHNLVIKMNDFLEKKLPLNHVYNLQTEFRQRTKRLVPKQMETGFFQFWHYFFHRFENGLRGIEWFYQETKSRLSNEERELAETWLDLTPKLVQAVKHDDQEIVFEDVFTNEQFLVPNNSTNVPNFLPWLSTFALLEPFQGKYHFNGVRQFNGPAAIDLTIQKIDQLIETTGKSREQVLIDYFPEILAQFISNEMELNEVEEVKNEIYQYTVTYKVLNDHELINFFTKQDEFVIDQLDEKDKQISWAKNWTRYIDNEMDGSIIFSEVFGSISIKNNELEFVSFDDQHVEEFKLKVESLSSVLSFSDEKINLITIPLNARVKNMLIQLDGNNIPQYFALYVQHDLSSELDISIPLYNGCSLRELVRIGRSKDAETWLKQTEYNMYLQVLKQFGEVKVTADFNSVRKELGLNLSPFVTGGEARQSAVQPIERPDKQEQLIEIERSDKQEQVITVEHQDQPEQVIGEEDSPYYEELGFSKETNNLFYSADLVSFYKEKTVGKGENTVRKYKNSLVDFRSILEQKSVSSWTELDEAFWEQLFTKDFPALYESITKTHQNDFSSTMNTLSKWIDSKYKTNCSEYVKKVKELVLR